MKNFSRRIIPIIIVGLILCSTNGFSDMVERENNFSNKTFIYRLSPESVEQNVELQGSLKKRVYLHFEGEQSRFPDSDSWGNPLVPYVNAKILLPPGKKVSNVIIKSISPKAKSLTYPVAVVTETIPLSDLKIPEKKTAWENSFFEGNVFKTNENYPNKIIDNYRIDNIRGYPVLNIDFNPVQVNPVSNIMTVHRELEIKIELDAGFPFEEEAVVSLRPGKEGDKQFLRSLIVGTRNNEKYIQAYEQETILLGNKKAGRAGNYYVIITTPDFASACEQIRQLRSFDVDHQASIVTLDEIPASVSGEPTYLEIKEYIQEVLYPDGVEYILIVGDCEFVPGYYPPQDGRQGDFCYTKIDGYHAIAIGRLSANTVDDINSYYQKISPAGSSGVIIPDGKDKGEINYVNDDVFLTNVEHKWEEYLRTSYHHDTDGMQSLVDIINEHSISQNVGHGYGAGMIPQWSSGYEDIPTDMEPFFNAFGCQSADFYAGPPNPDHFAEHPAEFYTNHTEYYSTVMGNTQNIRGTPFFYNFHHRFYESFFKYGVPAIGDMIALANPYGVLTLLGDPYLKIASAQLMNSPRIYAETKSDDLYQRTYVKALDRVDDIVIPIYIFDDCSWQVQNVTASDPTMVPHVVFDFIGAGQGGDLYVNFENIGGFADGDYTVNFDIMDMDNNIAARNVTIELTIVDINLLDTDDVIQQGDTWTLQTDSYVLMEDFIVPSGKTFVIPEGAKIVTLDDYGTDWKIIVEPAARIRAEGTVHNPVIFGPTMSNTDSDGIGFQLYGDGSEDIIGEFIYSFFNEDIEAVDAPKIHFDNCTLNKDWGVVLFPNPVKGEMKNSVVRTSFSGDQDCGHLSDLKISYSLVPHLYDGKGVVWKYYTYKSPSILPRSTSLSINAGDPQDSLDPDGTRKDMGAFYFSLNGALRVPHDHATIQEALDAAESHQVKAVVVSPGTYYENISIPPSVRLSGESEFDKPVLIGTNVNENLITPRIQPATDDLYYLIENFDLTRQVSGSPTGAVVFIPYETEILALRNCDFLNSQNNDALIMDEDDPFYYNYEGLVLSDVNFIDNHDNNHIICLGRYSSTNSWPSLIKESVYENNSVFENMIDLTSIDFTISDVVFKNNSGNLLYHTNDDENTDHPVVVKYCTFNGNGLASIKLDDHGDTMFQSNTFYNNDLTVELTGDAVFNLQDSIFWDNIADFVLDPNTTFKVNYSDINSAYPGGGGTGNIDQDPFFLNVAEENFGLQSGSPCIDSGDPSSPVPFNGGGVIDMGAFEYFQSTNGTPLKPSYLIGTAASSSQIDLEWENVDLEEGYEIWRSDDFGVTYDYLKSTGMDVNTSSDTGLEPGKAYVYQVRAFNINGYSDFSDPESISTLSTPDAPTNLTADAISTSQIDLTWTDNSYNEIGFRIFRGEEETSLFEIATVGVDITSFVDTGLLEGGKYYYQVKAYSNDGDSEPSNTAIMVTDIELDDSDQGVFVKGAYLWKVNHPNANKGDCYVVNPWKPTFSGWRINTEEGSLFDVYVVLFDNDQKQFLADKAHYQVFHKDGVTGHILVDQSQPGHLKIKLGTYGFKESGNYGVVGLGGENGYMIFDNIRLEYAGEAK